MPDAKDLWRSASRGTSARYLIVGLLQLFGFHLPETHHRYYLASSYTDFWRRINIYWKDFMLKIFYYPAYFKLRAWGLTPSQRALSARITIVCLITLLAGPTLRSSSYAAERRCIELGENCVCSEPLNGTLRRIGSSWYNPNDSETKECTVESFSDPALRGAALTRNANDLSPTNASSVLGALPTGHRVSSVVSAPEGYSGLWFLGHYFGDDHSFLKRLAVRWYRYYSPNYEMSPADNPACEQRGKLTEAHINFTSVGNGFSAYNFVNWTPNGRDCCGYVQTSYPTISQLRGKWWRFEYVMLDRNGPGHNTFLYVKNVTDNAPERLVYDFSRLSFWSPQFTPPSPVRFLRASQYAQGSCAGFAAVSHFMVAGWDTNVVQRIGPAYEIEGGESR